MPDDPAVQRGHADTAFQAEGSLAGFESLEKLLEVLFHIRAQRVSCDDHVKQGCSFSAGVSSVIGSPRTLQAFACKQAYIRALATGVHSRKQARRGQASTVWSKPRRSSAKPRPAVTCNTNGTPRKLRLARLPIPSSSGAAQEAKACQNWADTKQHQSPNHCSICRANTGEMVQSATVSRSHVQP